MSIHYRDQATQRTNHTLPDTRDDTSADYDIFDHGGLEEWSVVDWRYVGLCELLTSMFPEFSTILVGVIESRYDQV